jgi:hypothetical protein
MISVFAEFEGAMIQERVRAGLARARAQGKKLGRPRFHPKMEQTSAPRWPEAIVAFCGSRPTSAWIAALCNG